jgi:hypothetical protein
MRRINIFAISVIAAGLTACGGGGGSGSTTDTVGPRIPPASAATPFTASNFDSYAAPSAAAILASSATSDGLEGLQSANPRTSANLNTSSPVKLAMWALRSVQTNGREQAQAVKTSTQACTSGSLSVSVDDADNNNKLSARDSINFNATNCVVKLGALPINGAFSMTFNTITLDQADDVVSASLAANFSNFSSAGNTLNGAAAMTLDRSAISITYTNFTSTRGSAPPVIFNYSASFNSLTGMPTLSINGLITINNNTYTLSTPAAMRFGTAYPIAGTLRVVDAAGGRIDIVSNSAAGGSLDFDFYAPGASVRSNRISRAWSAI